MSRYYTIGQGLRGCYMPDSVYTIRVDTRRALKQVLEWEAESIRDAGGVGLSKRTIAALAAACWRDWPKQLENCAPYKWAATRADWQESEA